MSFMVPPTVEKYATLAEDVPMVKPRPDADPFSLMLVQLGIMPIEEAEAEGLIEQATLSAGVTGRVIEECSGECPHYLATGNPCAYAIEITSPGEFLGQVLVLTSEQVSVTENAKPEWDLNDDAAVITFLSDWNAGPEDGERDDYL